MYIYRAYQLDIHADFPIPEFPPGDATSSADVLIRRGIVPCALEKATGKDEFYQPMASRFLLTLNDVARYLVQNGNEIIVEPAPNCLESDVRVFLLGSAIGALLHQRGVLVIHAGAFYTERGAVLLTGPSGIGKSTLLGELLRRGYKFLVDDVCGVLLDASGLPLVLPGYPRTRLWSDAAQELKQDISTMERTRPGIEKYERQLPEQYWDQPAPLHRIYLLNIHDRDELSLTAVPPMNAFSIVLQNTYRQHFLDGLEMRTLHFRLVSAVARQTDVTRVTRPISPFRLTELADLIEQDLRQG